MSRRKSKHGDEVRRLRESSNTVKGFLVSMKKLLFVIETLQCAGAEKSLVSLLNLIDYNKYEVDLQLFSYGGEFETMLPAEVKLLPPLDYFEFTKRPLFKAVRLKSFFSDLRKLLCRLKYSALLRTGEYSNRQKAVMFWRHTAGCFEQTQKEYDIAIAYAQGEPTFYVADCVRAKKKFAWINEIYLPEGGARSFAAQKYAAVNRVVCVSDEALETFIRVFPELSGKGTIIRDINNARLVERMAGLPSEASEQMQADCLRLLTVGRLELVKGYDFAVEAGRILKENGVRFKWYVLGKGSLEAEIRRDIEEKALQDEFVLLGVKANPYPYYLNADIYVQPSRSEGFGLAIAEARILNIPVVATRFDAVYAQMVEGENGLVVDMDGKGVAEGIMRLAKDKALYEHIKNYLLHEKKGNTEEFAKFEALIEEGEE